jgi:hypothetical protein
MSEVGGKPEMKRTHRHFGIWTQRFLLGPAVCKTARPPNRLFRPQSGVTEEVRKCILCKKTEVKHTELCGDCARFLEAELRDHNKRRPKSAEYQEDSGAPEETLRRHRVKFQKTKAIAVFERSMYCKIELQKT